jgi:hypothetical protein
MLFLSWSHRYKNYTVVMAIWNIHISIDNWIFDYLRIFVFLYHCQDLYRTWMYIWVTRRVSYKKQKLLTLSEHMSFIHDVFTVLVPCCDVRYDFRIKRCSVCLYLKLFVWWLIMSYLRYLCLLAHSGVFLFCLYSSCVLWTQCCQFLCQIVHFFYSPFGIL